MVGTIDNKINLRIAVRLPATPCTGIVQYAVYAQRLLYLLKMQKTKQLETKALPAHHLLTRREMCPAKRVLRVLPFHIFIIEQSIKVLDTIDGIVLFVAETGIYEDEVA